MLINVHMHVCIHTCLNMCIYMYVYSFPQNVFKHTNEICVQGCIYHLSLAARYTMVAMLSEEALLGRRTLCSALLGRRRGACEAVQFSKTEASETLLGRRAITGIPDSFSAPALKVAYREPAMSDPIERYGESFSNEALQDLRPCGKCQTMSYLRKGFCINIHCADYFMLKEPALAKRSG